ANIRRLLFRTRRESQPQGLDQLIEEMWDTVFDFRRGRRRHGPSRDLGAAAANEFLAVETDELIQHRSRSRRSNAGCQEQASDGKEAIVMLNTRARSWRD